MQILKSFFVSLSVFAFSLAVASPTPATDGKFSYVSAKSKSPIKIEMKSVEYKAKGFRLSLLVQNDSTEGVDFSKADWKVFSGNRHGYIQQSDFDGLRVAAKSKRQATINFAFDEVSKPTFLQERSKGTSVINIENVQTYSNKKLPKITLKNY